MNELIVERYANRVNRNRLSDRTADMLHRLGGLDKLNYAVVESNRKTSNEMGGGDGC